MRILAIGLGGAGTRIVDLLYNHDRKSRVGCVSAVAVDMDGNSLRQLSFLPDNARMHFPAIDPEIHFDVTSTINIDEVMTYIQNMDHFDIDSIMIFAGLGGSVIDAVGQLTEELRKSYLEPIFGLCVLPMRNEGKRRSSKAADDIERVKNVLDAVILFDNETWYERLKAEFHQYSVDGGTATHAHRRQVFPDNPRDIYAILNEKIARQMGLILRAGEFSETGVETAEVVLDAGEVLNTLKNNELVAIGYATEPLRISFRDRFVHWRSDAYFSEASHKRATRIVTLAKRAVYEEISIPCDLTSAEKALVLIAGPSQELSMKGFQTVRKWIDRSIAGLEMRSGDYPVVNTRFVGIIIILAGVTNIPRVTELMEIRRAYLDEQEQAAEKEQERGRRERERREAQFAEQERDTGSGKETEVAQDSVPVGPTERRKDDGETTLDISDLFEEETTQKYTWGRDTEQEEEGNTTPVWQEEHGHPPYHSSEGDYYAEEETDGVTNMAARDGKQILNDGMITLDGVARSEKKKKHDKDDMISIGVKSEKKDMDEKLSMPCREERTVADITRMTSGGGILPPKDSVFGLKEIPSSNKNGPRDTALVGETIRIGKQDKRPNDTTFDGKKVSVSSVKGPNDSAYMGRSVSVTSSPRVSDNALMGKKIPMKSSEIRPNDRAFNGDSIHLSRGSPKPKEFMNGGVKMSAQAPPPKDDVFIRRAKHRMEKTGEATKEPKKESPYKKGTISSSYKKEEEPENDDAGDGLFWIK
jgi:cell division GTPase FtsZ